MSKALNFKPGQWVGDWWVIEQTGRHPINRSILWKCRCRCGYEAMIQASQLGIRSRGCKACHLLRLRKDGIAQLSPKR